MKNILLCLGFIVGAVSNSSAQHTGANWSKLNREDKVLVVVGMMEGLQLGAQFTVWDRGFNGTEKDFTEPLKKFKEFEDLYILGVPYGKATDAIDWVYSDPANESIDYPYALWIALNKVKGEPVEKLTKMCVSFRREPSSQPSRPATNAPAPTDDKPTVSMPEIKTEVPIRSGILFDANPGAAGLGELTITNGTNSFAVVKMIDRSISSKVLSAVIAPNDQLPIKGVQDGSFDIIFAFGDRLLQNTDNLFNPHGYAKFDTPQAFTTIRQTDGTRYTTVSITLNPVIGGNARTSKIEKAEFDKY